MSRNVKGGKWGPGTVVEASPGPSAVLEAAKSPRLRVRATLVPGCHGHFTLVTWALNHSGNLLILKLSFVLMVCGSFPFL